MNAYRRTPAYHRAVYDRRRLKLLGHLAERRTWLNSLKNAPCADCGREYPSYVMHFDHRDPSTKLFTIGNSMSRSLEAMRAEIEKCDVVCANCHAERTFGVAA